MGESLTGVLQDSLKLKIEAWDLAIIIAYLVGIVGLGCWAGLRRKQHEGDTYFLGGRTITWPIIGAALFASNISTVHMVSLAECGYKSGLLYGNFEWMAPFTLICLSLFFAPFYIRSGVTTLPDFLEKRYNRAARDWLAILSIVAAVVIHIGFAFFTGAWVLHGVFGINLYVCIVVVAALAGLYTVVGGLLAVMWTESVQTVILLTGAICITVIGLFSQTKGIGGWSALQDSVHPVNFSIIRPSSDPTGLSMWAVFLGYPVIGLWYWCCDQVIVQRVLAAKDENHARIGPLFTGFIKILPMFIFVLPGLICLGLISKGVHTDPLEDPKGALTYLIEHVLPTGMKGLMAAALLAAMMGSVSAALNSIATVFSYDIVKRWWPETSDRSLVLTGRVVTAVAMIAAIAWSPFIGQFKTIFQGLNDLICYMAPPVTAVFLLGVFWRRASGKAAVVTLWSGAALGAVIFLVDFFKIGLWSFPGVALRSGWPAVVWSEPGPWNIHSMITGFYMFLIAAATLLVFSYLMPHKHTADSAALVWKSWLEPLRGKSWRFLGNYRVVAALLFVTMVFLYWWFAGEASYYPVQFKLTLADGAPVRGAKVTLQCETDRDYEVAPLAADDLKVERWESFRFTEEGKESRVQWAPLRGDAAASLAAQYSGQQGLKAAEDGSYRITVTTDSEGRKKCLLSGGFRLPRYDFTTITDKNGECGYGTDSLAGGAPAGTRYRVKIEPCQITKVELSAEDLAKTLAGQRLATTMKVVEPGSLGDPEILKALAPPKKESPVAEGQTPEAEKWQPQSEQADRRKSLLLVVSDGAIISPVQGKSLMLLPKTPIHAKYREFATSGVQFLVEAKKNVVELKLDPPAVH